MTAIIPINREFCSARDFLVETVERLEREQPKYVFSTTDLDKVIFANESGSEVYGKLKETKGIMSGKLYEIDYDGLTVFMQGHLLSCVARYRSGTYLGLDGYTKKIEDIKVAEWKYKVKGEEHALPLLPKDENCALVRRVLDVFVKYETFERDNKRESGLMKLFYNLAKRSTSEKRVE